MMTKHFTGWHMATILIAFFGVVIAVNFTMARLATGTFGGTVVDNSYVASQKFNGWLAEAEAQKTLGWTETVTLQADRRVAVSLSAAGRPVAIESVAAVAEHPLGRAPSRTLTFVSNGAGQALATEPLPLGRWYVSVIVKSGGQEARYRTEVQ